MKLIDLALVVLAANALVGCSQMVDVDEGLSAEAKTSLIEANSLLTNSIDLNGLLSNSIDQNGIDPQYLSPAVQTALRDSGQLGINTRLLYRYLISCALDSSQSISFSWTDSESVVHPEVFGGSVGIAPHWKYTYVIPSVRRRVSACLGARANYYGTPVTISMRGPHTAINQISAEEQAAYPMEEGAFWGDVFGSTPQLYACHKTANITNSRAKLRSCAAGHLGEGDVVSECAHIAVLGDCDSLCDPTTANDPYHPSCMDPEIGAMNQVVTVYLPQ